VEIVFNRNPPDSDYRISRLNSNPSTRIPGDEYLITLPKGYYLKSRFNINLSDGDYCKSRFNRNTPGADFRGSVIK
jgi:hypothetical protein